nr:MAG TPA: hypothetical protein [Caudoviricetes sp.]
MFLFFLCIPIFQYFYNGFYNSILFLFSLSAIISIFTTFSHLSPSHSLLFSK